jgi:hypothetical protein
MLERLRRRGAKNVLIKAAPEIVEQIKQGKLRVSAIGKKVLAKPKAEQVAELKRLADLKSAPQAATTIAFEAYEKAEERLIEKLKAYFAVAPNDAEDVVAGTIKKLRKTVEQLTEQATAKAG